MSTTNNQRTNDPSGHGHIDEPMLLRPREAAKLLAISPRKLWELTSTKEIPVVRIGRSLRYPREALRGWIASRQGRRS
jgi:excisionase family DNA binding protein